jgi:hypothetical protein
VAPRNAADGVVFLDLDRLFPGDENRRRLGG